MFAIANQTSPHSLRPGLSDDWLRQKFEEVRHFAHRYRQSLRIE